MNYLNFRFYGTSMYFVEASESLRDIHVLESRAYSVHSRFVEMHVVRLDLKTQKDYT